MLGLYKQTLILNFLLIFSSATSAKVYKAEITKFGDSHDVTGTVVVITPEADDTATTEYAVAYGGFIEGTEKNCTGCGVHVHSGKSCEAKELQEGHYYVDPVKVDPWNEDTVYNADPMGSASFHGMVKMGTGDVDGRTFLIHASGGVRVGCGVLTEVPASETLVSSIATFGDAGASASMTFYQVGDTDAICYYAKASGLEKNINKFCGTHIHEGVSCENKSTQMGHYYNPETYPIDPWNVLGYSSTDAEGNTEFAHCVKTGMTEYVGKTFVVHSSDSSRVGCGVLEKSAGITRSPFVVLQAIFVGVLGFALSF